MIEPQHTMGQRKDGSPWRISTDFGSGVTVEQDGHVVLQGDQIAARGRRVTFKSASSAAEIGAALIAAAEFAGSLTAEDLRGYDD